MRLPRPQWRWLHWLWRIPLALLLIIILLLLLWRTQPLPTTAFMLQQSIAARFDDSIPTVRYEWVDRSQMPDHVKLAVIASEDQRFALHDGIDTQATQDAIEAALAGKSSGGGSTITQQVAKNIFLWGGRSYIRKGLEWGLALLIDALWSKERILEVYLNIAQFSAADYGVGAASHDLFKKPCNKLSPREAALLAAVLPAPTQFNAAKPSAYIQKRQRQILRQMRLLGGSSYFDQFPEQFSEEQ
ncbi:monofunctional biosynthetic peptidoglycan transglycosylase [Thiolinea disciformis]|uniref:monofunctional biosynthetic peptidoglycan transglycosylase n=1 Tax=Thiolinea disciformis TaxID=125614 RepID=UPI000371715A|nr:monofunctional biosynthetic peptidoglycan transglycosylase [Thiolinea disciformis]